MSYPEVWAELRNAVAAGAWARVKRRVDKSTPLDLFLAVAKPSNERMLLMAVHEASLDGLDGLPASKGVEARIVRPGEDGADASLEIVLRDDRAEDIFTALAIDIVDAACLAQNERMAVAAVVDRLERWQRFLEVAGPEGLSGERQRGLYGELCFLRNHLLPLIGVTGVEAWTGPIAASHDFHLGMLAVEVKTSAAKQHQVLRIASERQLDATGVETLLLHHLSFDVHLGSGESLVDAVAATRDAVQDAGGSARLEASLLAAGYIDAHRPLYERAGYTVREENFFEVVEGFPRIVEGDLPSGVGDVRYSVAVSECRHFSITAEDARALIRNAHDN